MIGIGFLKKRGGGKVYKMTPSLPCLVTSTGNVNISPGFGTFGCISCSVVREVDVVCNVDTDTKILNNENV